VHRHSNTIVGNKWRQGGGSLTAFGSPLLIYCLIILEPSFSIVYIRFQMSTPGWLGVFKTLTERSSTFSSQIARGDQQGHLIGCSLQNLLQRGHQAIAACA
jgi:hypothetical protein